MLRAPTRRGSSWEILYVSSSSSPAHLDGCNVLPPLFPVSLDMWLMFHWFTFSSQPISCKVTCKLLSKVSIFSLSLSLSLECLMEACLTHKSVLLPVILFILQPVTPVSPFCKMLASCVARQREKEKEGEASNLASFVLLSRLKKKKKKRTSVTSHVASTHSVDW